MTNLNLKANNLIVECLKKVKETQWVGNLTFESMDQAVTSIMVSTSNSGWYSPTPFKINGLTGWFVAHEDGQICFEYRIIKVDDNIYLKEELSMEAFNDFEVNLRLLI